MDGTRFSAITRSTRCGAAMMLLGLTTLSTLVTYHYFVRSTAIGELLNGRRYPRALPRLTPREAGA